MAFATVEDVTRRLEEEPNERMLVMIGEYLEDATDAVKYIAGSAWTDLTVPDAIRRIVASAVARFMRNPDGYVQSRAGDETIAWGERDVNELFTEGEISRIVAYAAPTRLKGFGTMGTVTGTVIPRRKHIDAIYVPSYDGTNPFPFLTAEDPLTGRYA